MFASNLKASELLRRWHSQIAPRLLSPMAWPRAALALGYLVNGPVADGLVCIEDLILTVLYDQPHGDGSSHIRLAGYTGRAIAWGACWGGRSQQKFEKDLSVPPERGAMGRRIELTKERLLGQALELDQLVSSANSGTTQATPAIQLPTLWAAFRPTDARSLQPSGPEFDALRQRLRMPTQQLVASYRRRHLGLVLLPLEWVSHTWQQWVTLLADVSQYPTCQVIRRTDLRQQLEGYCGAVRYDLLASRFAGRGSRDQRRAEDQQLAMASA